MNLNTKNKAGLGLAGLLGVLDIAGYFFTPDPSADMPGPPDWIVLLDVALGIITVIAVFLAFRSPNKLNVGTTVTARVLSALTAVPAYFVGVPTSIIVLVTAFIAATIITVWLILSSTESSSGL
jgi:hypothetical protein